ncbi:MAG: hypothetical protein AB7F36_08605, partial [Reyranellaceae bacterium]
MSSVAPIPPFSIRMPLVPASIFPFAVTLTDPVPELLAKMPSSCASISPFVSIVMLPGVAPSSPLTVM